MSYGCGDDNCTSCYGPANYAVYHDGEILERWVDEAALLELLAEDERVYEKGGEGHYPEGVEVEYEPDPRFTGTDAWADRDPDKIGPVSDPLPTDETGWSKDHVWYGEQMGDDAVSLGYQAAYERELPNGEVQCLDVTYYVTGKPGDYGVEECDHSYRRDLNREPIDGPDEQYDYDYGSPLSYRTYAHAIAVARSLALADERFKLVSWQPA